VWLVKSNEQTFQALRGAERNVSLTPWLAHEVKELRISIGFMLQMVKICAFLLTARRDGVQEEALESFSHS
jgi:hypothetical protein